MNVTINVYHPKTATRYKATERTIELVATCEGKTRFYKLSQYIIGNEWDLYEVVSDASVARMPNQHRMIAWKLVAKNLPEIKRFACAYIAGKMEEESGQKVTIESVEHYVGGKWKPLGHVGEEK